MKRALLAPIPALGGESVLRLGAGHAIALFPFVEGEAGEFGYYEDDDDGRRAVGSMLAELHRATAAVGPDVRMVLLKGVDERGFDFYTNLGSPKAKALQREPRVAGRDRR